MLRLTASDFYTFFRPSKCENRIYLKHIGKEQAPLGPYDEVLFRLGERHEVSYLRTYPEYVDLSEVTLGEREKRTKEEILQETRVLYQAVLRASHNLGGTRCVVSDSGYLLGILNSQITQYLVSQNAAKRQSGFLEFKPMYISPLAILEQPKGKKISPLVNQILTAKRTDPNAEITALEAEIDARVAHLYKLTEEEYSLILSELKPPDPVRIAALNCYRDIARGVLKGISPYISVFRYFFLDNGTCFRIEELWCPYGLNRESRENRERARRCNPALFHQKKGTLLAFIYHCSGESGWEGC